MDKYFHVISDNNAPEGLKGKTITAILTEGMLEFQVDLEEEPNEQEAGYLKWFTGELVDQMKEEIKENQGIDAENMFSLPRYSVEKQ